MIQETLFGVFAFGLLVLFCATPVSAIAQAGCDDELLGGNCRTSPSTRRTEDLPEAQPPKAKKPAARTRAPKPTRVPAPKPAIQTPVQNVPTQMEQAIDQAGPTMPYIVSEVPKLTKTERSMVPPVRSVDPVITASRDALVKLEKASQAQLDAATSREVMTEVVLLPHVSMQFLDVELRAEELCSQYRRGVQNNPVFLNCVGDTVEQLVFSSNDHELIAYFRTLFIR